MWSLARKKSASSQAWPLPGCRYREASTPGRRPLTHHLVCFSQLPCKRFFSPLYRQEAEAQKSEAACPRHLPVSGRAGSHLGLFNARFQQVVTFCTVVALNRTRSPSGTHLMLLGGHGMRLAKRDGSLHATLPATDSGNITTMSSFLCFTPLVHTPPDASLLLSHLGVASLALGFGGCGALPLTDGRGESRSLGPPKL